MDPNLSKAIIDFFMGIPLFSRMNAEEVKLVAKHMNVIELQQGEILFQEADRGNFMCFIAHGTLDVIKQPTAVDQEIVITTLRKGQSIGEMSVIENLPRSATIRARDNAKLFILSQAAFDKEIADTYSTIQDATGGQDSGRSKLLCLRPPYGASNGTVASYAAALGYELVLWDLDPQDWRQPGADQIAKHIIDNARPGKISVTRLIHNNCIEFIG